MLATFVGTSAIYVCLIRPFWFVRPFFGMKMDSDCKARVREPAKNTKMEQIELAWAGFMSLPVS
jgi:hypothetical protein